MPDPLAQTPGVNLSTDPAEAVARVRLVFDTLTKQIHRVIVGQDEVVEQILIAMFCRGHALVEGVPGLAKTLLISTIARTLSLGFSRIQFTPDLMPSDITGTEVIEEDKTTGSRELRFVKGPIFANVILADEINRTPPKTQAALLEAMQEHQVTVGGMQHKLPDPFFVLATQNPIEQEGTYPLPEAQLDRFIFKINVGYSQLDDLMTILDRTTGSKTPEVRKVIDGPQILAAMTLIRDCIVAPHVKEYAARLVLATHPGGEHAVNATGKYVRCGASPRAAQALLLGGKVRALTEGRYHVSNKDVQEVALLALRHRVILNFEAEADRVTQDDVVREILKATPTEPVKVR